MGNGSTEAGSGGGRGAGRRVEGGDRWRKRGAGDNITTMF